MHRTLLTLLFGLLLAASALAQQTYPTHWGEFSVPRHPGDFVNTVRPERFVTPHLPFAKPLRGGPVKVLFICNPPTARDIAELYQRLDLVFEEVLPANGVEMGWTHPIHTAVIGLTIPEKERELDAALDDTYDVICLIGIEFKSLPAKTRFEILRQVREGAGLLGTFANCRDRQIEKPLVEQITAAEVLRETPLSGMPYLADKPAEHWLTLAQFGKGRIAWLNYSGAHNQRHWYRGDGLGRPAVPTPHSPWPTAEACDAAMTLAARALLWTARREPAARLEPALADGSTIDIDAWDGKVTGTIRRVDETLERLTVEARFVRPSGSLTTTGKTTVDLADEATPFSIDLAGPATGTAWLFLTARDADGAVVDFTCTGITATAGRSIVEAAFTADAVDPDGSLELRARLEGDLGIAALRLRAFDVYGRLFHEEELAADAELTATVPVSAARGRNGLLVADLTVGPRVVDQRLLPFYVRREFGHEFIRLIWGHPGIPSADSGHMTGYIATLMGRQLEAAGWNAGMIFSSDAPDAGTRRLARANAGCFDYCAHIQKGHFHGFFDPEARAKELERLVKRGARSRDFAPFAHNLGDENALPRGGAVWTMTDHELATFHQWLADEYGDLASLNDYWESDYADFAEIKPDDCKGREVPVPRIVDLLRFWDWGYAWAHREKARAVREGDPAAKVGAEGSMSGDLELTINGLDWWAPYYNRYVNTQLRFWMPEDSLRANWWGGYTMRRVGPEALWMQLATGSVNASFWFIGRVGPEGAFSADISLADHVESWQPETRYIERHAGPLIKASQSINDGMAIYWDRTSEHVNGADARFGSGIVAQRELIRLCDGLGINARFVSRRDIQARGLDPETTRILLMCVVKTMPADVPAALEGYVRAGGILIVDVAPDVRDERGRAIAPGRLLGLCGVTSEGAEPKAAAVDIRTERLAIKTSKPCTVDASVTATEGRAFGQAGEIPLLVERRLGKGRTIFLNFPLYEALGLVEREDVRTTPAGDLLLDILALGGVTPHFPPQPGMPWGSVRTFRHTDATVVGLHGWDSEAKPMRFVAGGKQRLHVLSFPEEFDGVGSIDLPANSGESLLVAVLPPADRELTLDAPARTKPGETVVLTPALRVGGEIRAGSLLRLDIFAPDGTRLEAHEQYRLSPGVAPPFGWPVALNVATGAHRVVLTELVSGTSIESTIEVTAE